MKMQQRNTRQILLTGKQSLIVVMGVAVVALCALVLIGESSAPRDESTTTVGPAVMVIAQRVVEVSDVSVLSVLSVFKM